MPVRRARGRSCLVKSSDDSPSPTESHWRSHDKVITGFRLSGEETAELQKWKQWGSQLGTRITFQWETAVVWNRQAALWVEGGARFEIIQQVIHICIFFIEWMCCVLEVEHHRGLLSFQDIVYRFPALELHFNKRLRLKIDGREF